VSMLEEGRVSGDQCGLGTEGRAQGERRMKVRTDVRVLVFFADELCSWAAPLLGRDQRPSLAYVAQRGLACSARASTKCLAYAGGFEHRAFKSIAVSHGQLQKRPQRS